MACACLSTQRFAALAKAMSEQSFGSNQVSELNSLKAVCKKPHDENLKTLIDNVFIYTADVNNTVISDGWVLIHGKQIVALGKQDTHLVGNPQISFFKNVHHTLKPS